jgi:PPM family protein phosphatase
MGLTLVTAAVSDVGLVRGNNEDTVYAGRRVVAVADGIGGQPAGELASDLVIRALAELDEGPAPLDPLAALHEAVDRANRQIWEAASASPDAEGMGTTVVAMLLSGDDLALLHVGDSRGYGVRDGRMSRITRDDTLVQALVDQGVLTDEEARGHPQRSIVTQAVQGRDFVPTGALLDARPGDRFLLCSDGLSDYVPDAAIEETLVSVPDPQQCAEALVKLTLQGGAPDNVTVLVADIAAG